MAIKERKQITGTEAQIKGYAGHNGVLAYATDTKHLHVLSGTAGTTTKLANVSDIPAPVDISGKADKTYVDTQLGTKATKTELTTGLAGKANTSHTHTKSQITDFPEIPDMSTLIPKTGNRGNLSGYETVGFPSDSSYSINRDSYDSVSAFTGHLTIENGGNQESWCKVVHMQNGEITLGDKWKYVGGSIPELRFPLFVVAKWDYDFGIVSIVSG